METKKFQTETKKLLDLMINSIYTHKEIFLRELISNASDAIDKRHYLSLTDEKYLSANDYEIFIEADKENNTLTITDNGIGMTKDEVIKNLGTIAKSGSKEFLERLEEGKMSEVDIIGQFGVGFYSSFMVAKKVTVETRSADSDKGVRFISDGFEKYSIEDIDKETIGTKIILEMKDDTEDEKYSKYLEYYQISSLVKKYSDYVRYPIKTYKVEEKPIKDSEGKDTEEYEEIKELVTLNTMVPIWKKNKQEVTEEELNEFYKAKFSDYENPLITINTSVEGNITYNALCYIPSHTPYNLYSENYERGLQLYTKGIFILDKCKELIPNYLRFVSGLVDSADLSLNISREMLQHDKQISKIASNLEKKILSELQRTMKNDREKYEKFFDTFGINLKYGAYDNYGFDKDKLKDLLLFKKSSEDKYISLEEYVSNMKEGQNDIYFATGKTRSSILSMPQMDMFKQKGYEVLVLTDDVDEFLLMVLENYNDKKFLSISSANLDLLNEDEKKELDEKKENSKDLLALIKEALGDKVKDVTLSANLTNAPVCLSNSSPISANMERVLNEMPYDNNLKAERILEINPNHDVYEALEGVYQNDKNMVKKYASILYDEALLIEGGSLENPLEFANLIAELMKMAAK